MFVMPVHLRFQNSPQHQETATFRVLQNELYAKMSYPQSLRLSSRNPDLHVHSDHSACKIVTSCCFGAISLPLLCQSEPPVTVVLSCRAHHLPHTTGNPVFLTGRRDFEGEYGHAPTGRDARVNPKSLWVLQTAKGREPMPNGASIVYSNGKGLNNPVVRIT